jgi:chaperonin GroES
MLEPLGYRVMVRPKDMEQVTEGGIVIPDSAHKREKAATQEGVVAALGSQAYSEVKEPWCEVGDHVLYAKYGGVRLQDPDTGIEYVMINDDDILCKIGETSE